MTSHLRKNAKADTHNTNVHYKIARWLPPSVSLNKFSYSRAWDVEAELISLVQLKWLDLNLLQCVAVITPRARSPICLAGRTRCKLVIITVAKQLMKSCTWTRNPWKDSRRSEATTRTCTKSFTHLQNWRARLSCHNQFESWKDTTVPLKHLRYLRTASYYCVLRGTLKWYRPRPPTKRCTVFLENLHSSISHWTQRTTWRVTCTAAWKRFCPAVSYPRRSTLMRTRRTRSGSTPASSSSFQQERNRTRSAKAVSFATTRGATSSTFPPPNVVHSLLNQITLEWTWMTASNTLESFLSEWLYVMSTIQCRRAPMGPFWRWRKSRTSRMWWSNWWREILRR